MEIHRTERFAITGVHLCRVHASGSPYGHMHNTSESDLTFLKSPLAYTQPNTVEIRLGTAGIAV